MKLYFARHGHTDAGVNSPISPISGEIDEPLNQEGVRQAEDLAEQLRDVHFDAIIASPLKRSYQTAEIVNRYHNIPVEISPVWREREIGEYVDLETWNNLFDFNQNFSLEHSEDLRGFFNRVYGAIDDLKQKYADKTVLIVSHIGVHLALYAYVNNPTLTGDIEVGSIGNCEYRIYELTS